MAMHDLVPLDQALLPSNIATAFGLEQPETDAKAESRPLQLPLSAPGNAAPSTWPVPGGFMPVPSGMLHAAPALQSGQMPPVLYEQQMNSAAMGSQQASYARAAQQGGAQQASAGPQRTAGQTAAAATAGRGDNKETTNLAMTKKPRVAWTPELHKRFVDAVTELGVHTAVPKAIMQKMNVEGLTRENVASHLQKYRLQLKREHE